jgi:predicted  nucleic acid-binding Zn-ribbon protein
VAHWEGPEDEGRDLYACDRCGSRFHSARAAFVELCPRCLLRDDAAAPLMYRPDERRKRDATEAAAAAEKDEEAQR